MAGILIKEAIIISMNSAFPDNFEGDIYIKNNRIEKITMRPDQLDAKPNDRIIDAGNLIILPGFINAHGHAAMTLFRGYADDMPLNRWLEQKIWPIEALLTEEDVYWGTMLGIAEMIKGGTTTFTDMYFFMDQAAQAVAESKIRAVLSVGLLGLANNHDHEINLSRKFIETWHGKENGRINVILGPHSLNTVPPIFMQKVVDLAEESGRPIQLHLSETAEEVQKCIAEHGCTPVQLVNRIGLFDFPVIAAHCVHIDDRDIELLSIKNVGVAHNPGSNLKLGSGVAPVVKMLEQGISVCLGTDGASSNNNLDMVEEMRLAALLAKGITKDPTNLNAETALKMATVNGARVLKLQNLGMIKEGYRADLIGIQHNKLHMTPLHEPLAQVVYAAGAADVQLSIVDGEILLDKGELTTIDEDRVRSEAIRCAKRLIEGRSGK